MATVTNLNPNPRAATVATGSEAGPNSSGAPTQVADAAFPLGTAFTETSTPATSGTQTGIYTAGPVAGFISVSGGDFVVVRQKIKVHAGTGTPELLLQVLQYTSVGGAITAPNFVDYRTNCTIGTVYELMGFVKVPANCARIAVAATQIGSTGSTTLRASECLVYRNPPAGVGLAPYADVTSTYLPPAPVDPSVLHFSVNDNAPTYGDLSPGQFAQMARELGATAVRFGSGSADSIALKPSSAAATNFAFYDRYLVPAIASGLKPILISPAAPSWMRTGPDAYIPNSSNYAAYGSLCAELAARYPEAAAFEVWNEPNLFWSGADGFGGVSMAAYVAMLQAIYPKVKAAVPSMPVIAGSSANVGSTAGLVPNEITADSMWSQFYSNGGKNYCDGLSLHPYNQQQGPTIATTSGNAVAGNRSLGVIDHLAIVRKYKEANSDTAKPLWITEAGGSSGTGYLSEADQATHNRLFAEMMADRGRNSDVRCVGFNSMVDHATDGGYAQGLAQVASSQTFRRKTTFTELQQVMAGVKPTRRHYGAPGNRYWPTRP